MATFIFKYRLLVLPSSFFLQILHHGSRGVVHWLHLLCFLRGNRPFSPKAGKQKKGHFVSMNPWGLCLIPVLTFQLTFDVVRRWCHSWKPIGSPQIKWRQLFWCLLLMGNGEKQAYSAKTLVLSSLLSEMFVVEKLSCWFSQHNGFRSIEFFTLKTFI